MSINYCGLTLSTINYLKNKSKVPLENRFSEYLGKEVVYVDLGGLKQLDIASTKEKHQIVVIELGVNWKVHKINECGIYKIISEITRKEEGSDETR